MKTNETLDTIIQASMYAFRMFREAMQSQAIDLVTCVDKERFNGSNKPENTIREFIKYNGEPSAVVLIATFVNMRAWDGRISRDNAEWARQQECAFDEEAALRLGMATYVDKIHTAHLDQLADALRSI